MNHKYLHSSLALLLVIIGTISVSSCLNSNVKEGEVLAKQYCSSCHLQPMPSDLPKNVWKYSTLPYMGMMMGLDEEINNLPEILSTYTILKSPQPLISQEDYEKIKAYYLSEAPEKVSDEPEVKYPINSKLFEIQEVKLQNPTIPNFTCVKFDPISKQIIAGDQSNRIIWFLNNKGEINHKLENQDALTNVHSNGNSLLMTFIGSTTQANPNTEGSIKRLTNGSNFQTVLNQVKRPLEGLEINLDREGDQEIITCEFGFDTGGLSVWKKEKSSYKKYVIDAQTGCTSVKVQDFNKDGLLDILALFAQGNERITLFLNKGNLTFESKNLLQFSPIWGTSSFDLADLNSDGQLDIITSAGDNADFSTVLKPFHGVRIFLNKGNFQFNNPIFFQQNGSTHVQSGDFDKDGDLDLISISLFPNVTKNPQEQILFIENQNGKFIPQGIPAFDYGRYAVMDCADIDADGDLDVILGSHAVAKFAEGQFNPSWKNATGITILKNISPKM